MGAELSGEKKRFGNAFGGIPPNGLHKFERHSSGGTRTPDLGITRPALPNHATTWGPRHHELLTSPTFLSWEIPIFQGTA